MHHACVLVGLTDLLRHHTYVFVRLYISMPWIHIAKSLSKYLCWCTHRFCQSHSYTVYIGHFWQGDQQMYGHIRCRYTVLANPMHTAWYKCRQIPYTAYLWHKHTHTHTYMYEWIHTLARSLRCSNCSTACMWFGPNGGAFASCWLGCMSWCRCVHICSKLCVPGSFISAPCAFHTCTIAMLWSIGAYINLRLTSWN